MIFYQSNFLALHIYLRKKIIFTNFVSAPELVSSAFGCLLDWSKEVPFMEASRLARAAEPGKFGALIGRNKMIHQLNCQLTIGKIRL